MLKLTSRFVLEVLPYLLSALIAAVLVPGFLYSLITVALPGSSTQRLTERRRWSCQTSPVAARMFSN